MRDAQDVRNGLQFARIPIIDARPQRTDVHRERKGEGKRACAHATEAEGQARATTPVMQSSLPHTPRVVIAEQFAERGLAVLREHGIDIDSQVGRTRAELVHALAEADGLIVRSETRVDRDLLAAGPKLSVVARAGVGVDAIDVDAATDAGIIVLNTPGANTIAATEQTFALMLSLVRRTPAAVQSLKSGARVSVPPPTIASGTAARMARIASSAHAVRSVTSSTRSPPRTSASASGTACSSCWMVSTGITGETLMMSRIFAPLAFM